jgi:hypothetical protein
MRLVRGMMAQNGRRDYRGFISCWEGKVDDGSQDTGTRAERRETLSLCNLLPCHEDHAVSVGATSLSFHPLSPAKTIYQLVNSRLQSSLATPEYCLCFNTWAGTGISCRWSFTCSLGEKEVQIPLHPLKGGMHLITESDCLMCHVVCDGNTIALMMPASGSIFHLSHTRTHRPAIPG